ncbi:MAG: glycosyltransferase family 4 protein, partial [Caldilineaceae bacterium]|nr:glycosyltransferase family 4 protein [Caldilineaceae bacterium]
TLQQLPAWSWLRKVHEPLLDRSLGARLYFQQAILDRRLAAEKIDLLLVPGGMYSGNFHPFVAVCQNMLPFQWSEMRRFWRTIDIVRFGMIRQLQSRTFRNADGMVFLTEFAKEEVLGTVSLHEEKTTVIPHGIHEDFFFAPRPQLSIDRYSFAAPFRILYVSMINLYKHQWHVADAVYELRQEGLPVELTLIGPAYPPALRRLEKKLRKLDPEQAYLKYMGAVPHAELGRHYQDADMFVFASSCENMPNILLEAMAAGLPIASSDREPMPEILGDAGIYFDPEDPQEIAAAIRRIILDPIVRTECAQKSYRCATDYLWEQTAQETFAFLAKRYACTIESG